MRLMLIVTTGLLAIAAAECWRESLSSPPPQPLVGPIHRRVIAIYTENAPPIQPHTDAAPSGGFCGGLGGTQTIDEFIPPTQAVAGGGTLGGQGTGGSTQGAPRVEAR